MFKLYKLMANKFKCLSFLTISLTLLQVVSFLVLPILLGQLTRLIGENAYLIQNNLSTNRPITIEILRINFLCQSHRSALMHLGGYFALFLIIGTISAMCASLLASYVSQAGSKQIRSCLWKHLGSLSQKDIEAFSNAKILTRFTIDISRIQTGLMSFLRMLIIGPFNLVLGLVFALLTNLQLSMIFLVVIPLLTLTMVISGVIWNPIQKKEQEMYDKINIESRENILGAKVIKSYNMEQIQWNKFQNVNKNWGTITSKSWIIFTITFNFIEIISNIAIAFIVFFVGKQTSKENIADFSKSIGNGVTFMNYVMTVTFGVVASSFTTFNIFKANVSSKRIFEIMNKKPDIAKIKSDKLIVNGEIEFSHVSFKYYESAKSNVLEDISFTLKPGKVLGIIGPTGSGKSTIAKLLNLDFKTQDGLVTIDGHNIQEIDTDSLRKNISHVYQNPCLLSGTIKSNLLLAKPNATDEEIELAAKNGCAFEYINKFKEKFEHVVEQKGANLSGGQKQRLSIAQGLIKRPKILILDDSTSALDARTEAMVRNNIKEEFKYEKISLVIIAQKISAIIDADEILVLNQGKIIDRGNHEELISRDGLYKEIAYSQLGGNNE